MENRSGMIVKTDLTRATGSAERQTAIDIIHRHSPGSTRRLTLGADKGYDAAEFVTGLRQACVTQHIVQKSRYSAIDWRTTHHKRYVLSLRHRKGTEVAFGCAKIAGGASQTTFRGIESARARFIMTLAAANMARLPRLLAL